MAGFLDLACDLHCLHCHQGVPKSSVNGGAHAQVPGGERVPFLFTIKELQASGDLAKFGGTFKVPSYRGSTFLDPKVGKCFF